MCFGQIEIIFGGNIVLTIYTKRTHR